MDGSRFDHLTRELGTSPPSAQSIECNLCVVDLGICQSYRYDCPGCCETVDDVGVCACVGT